MKYLHLSVSKIGLKRLDNEDAVGVFEIDGGILAILCDGLGGNKAGEVASQLTIDTVRNVFSDVNDSDILNKIKSAIFESNKKIIDNSKSDFDLKGMATTAEVLYVKDDTAYWGHIGDSRIYQLINKNLRQLTKDHSLVQKLVDEGYLTMKEAENHPNKNIIMRALGDSEIIEVDLSKQKINSGDNIKFFICTDGVTAVLNDDEIQNILLGNNLEDISSTLTSLIEERGAPDNFSFIIISKAS
ncbi:MAG: protein phosphatase 2C domain-containing protein [Ignavibacteriaceae bacterium]